MDSDTTTRVGDHARLLERFAEEGDILVGTQMVAKGLDFPTGHAGRRGRRRPRPARRRLPRGGANLRAAHASLRPQRPRTRRRGDRADVLARAPGDRLRLPPRLRRLRRSRARRAPRAALAALPAHGHARRDRPLPPRRRSRDRRAGPTPCATTSASTSSAPPRTRSPASTTSGATASPCAPATCDALRAAIRERSPAARRGDGRRPASDHDRRLTYRDEPSKARETKRPLHGSSLAIHARLFTVNEPRAPGQALAACLATALARRAFLRAALLGWMIPFWAALSNCDSTDDDDAPANRPTSPS